ncbi:hypothetical protein M3202_07305 [Alkalihalobacillus oceani]|uniref:Uncharacterized protein n=1 Tax=Halalkalibacter oceani TaxID=1653776 RepID=A0A9X2IPT0_9BACI|nr:hypothetical protein [Halalkalibacter oceani]MCM3713888.1 hypothetical protein [Halalkalibacter oceani]
MQAHVKAESQVTPRALTLKSGLLLSMCFFYLVHFFVPILVLQYGMTLLTMAAFFLCLPKASPFPRYFASMMFAVGFFLAFMRGEDLRSMSDGVLMNLPLLTLVLLVPLLSIPFKLGGYFQAIHYYLQKMVADSKKLFASISLFLFCFGPILNLGSIRVVHDMVNDLKLHPVLLGKAYLVGFSTVILWSPYFASVALVLYYLELNVTDYMLLGISFALIQLVVGNLLYALYYKKWQRYTPKEEPESEQATIANSGSAAYYLRKMLRLVGLLVLLMTIIFLLEYMTRWPMMLLVSLVAILFPVVWSILNRKWKALNQPFAEYRRNMERSMNNEVVMFISAGVFATALSDTAFAASINQWLNLIASESFLLFSVTVVLMILLLTFIGIHTIVVVTVLIIQMDPAVIGTSPAVLALLFMMSWSMSAALSPVNPFNLLVSSSVGKPGVIVGLRWNGIYIASMFVIGIVFVYLIH